ncbi:MAG: hypothetical protein AAF353_01510 [Pseudomonadota bacterium]
MINSVFSITGFKVVVLFVRQTRMPIRAMLAIILTFSNGVVTAGDQSTEAGQQCLDSQANQDFLRAYSVGEETENFLVLAPNKLQMKSEVSYQVIKTRSWGEVYVFNSTSSAMGNVTVCGCGGGCAPSCESKTTGGIAICSGGCYKSGEPCLSCEFRELDIEISTSPIPTD